MLAVVSAVGEGGATVTQVAQRHDVTRQQIYAHCRVVPNCGSLRVGWCFAKFVDLNYGSQARPAL